MNKIDLYLKRNNIFGGLSAGVIDRDKKVKETADKNKQLLDYIYSVDPVNGMLYGDLAMFYNPKANVEVKQFIEQNLMLEHDPSSNSPLSLPTDTINKMRGSITDDDIAYFSRGNNETKEMYAARLRDYFAHQRFENYKKRELSRIEKEINRNDD